MMDSDLDSENVDSPDEGEGVSSASAMGGSSSSKTRKTRAARCPSSSGKKTVQLSMTAFVSRPEKENETEDNDGIVVQAGPSSSSASKNANIETASADIISESDLKKITGRSVIWNFFVKSKDGLSGQCNECTMSKSTPTGATTLLIRHLKHEHPSSFKEYKRLEKLKQKIINIRKEKYAKLKNKQEKVTGSGPLVTLNSKSKRSLAITDAIAIFICKGLHPFSVVEEKGFRNLIWKLEPRYVIPSRTTFSRSVVPKMYKKLKQELYSKLAADLETLESVSITVDLWTSRSQDPFISFVLQYVDDNFFMNSFTLECEYFPGNHDAATICQKMYDVIKNLDLDREFIAKYVVSDNGSNVICAFDQPSVERQNDPNTPEILRRIKSWKLIRCSNHTLQLAIGDTKTELGANSVIDKVTAQVSRYNRSRHVRDRVDRIQKELNLPSHGLLQTVKTRWDADHKMMSRYVEQKLAIIAELAEAGEEGLSANDWKLAEGFVEVLEPIAKHTAELGSSKVPTLSQVIPVLNEIDNDLNEFIKKKPRGSGITFARKLLANIENRTLNFQLDQTYQIAMYVDPRFKELLFNENLHYKAESILKEKALEKYRQHISRGLITPASDVQEENIPDVSPAKKSRFRHLKSKKVQAPNDEEDIFKAIEAEVKAYLSVPCIDPDECPLKWWRANRSLYPHLAPVAKEYLGIAATETGNERVFSVGGNVVTNKRTKLLPQRVQEIVFCHDNLNVPERSTNY